MIKRHMRRVLALILVLVILFPTITIPALAATSISGLSVPNLSAEYTFECTFKGDGSWAATSDGQGLKGTAKGYKGMTDVSSFAGTSTLTLKNNGTETATLSFNYDSSSVGRGSVKINGTSPSETTGTYTQELGAGSSITIALSSAKNTTVVTFQISNLKLIFENNVTVKFLKPEGGTYKVGDMEITADTNITQSSKQPFSVSATADSSHKFFGWYNETTGKYESYQAITTLMFEEDVTIYPVFLNSSTCIFLVGDKYFKDLNEANTYADSLGGSKIVLVSDGTLPSGSYTITSGNTLLIPFDDAHTCYTTEPGLVDNGTYTNPTYYRKLTMNSGAKIIVESGATFSVSGKLNSPDARSTSGTIGTYGWIYMNNGSEIVVNGTLSCYGFITGSGVITVNASAEVHETFALPEFRGGGGLYAMYNNSNKVFPASQYYIQNIGAPMTLYSGATLTGHTSIYITTTESSAPQSILVVGKDDGLFQLKKGTLTKQYVSKEDRCQIDINGEAEISGISLGMTMLLVSYTFDSTKYVLPINGHFNINLLEGTVVTVGSDIELLPGVKLGIAEKAELVIASGKNMYTYDSDQWAKYVYSNKRISPFLYYPDREYKRSDNAADLSDVLIDVNGKITANGGFYTTTSGANIISSKGTGSVTFANEVGTSKAIYQASAQTGGGFSTEVTYDTIGIISAQLHNTDGSYTTTTDANSGDTYQICEYCHKWYKVGSHYTIILYVDGNLSETMCSSTNSVTFSGVTSIIKSESNPVCTVNASSDGLTVSGLTAGVTEVKVWTKPVARIMSNDGNVIGQYVSLADAISNYADTGYIQMLDTSETGTISIDKDVYLDLNGQTVQANLTIGEGYTLYGMDCKTDDYDGSDAGKITGTVTGTGTVAPVFETDRKPDNDYNYHRYVSIQTDNVWSFHRFNISVNGYRFELSSITPECALFFLGKFRGDSTARDYLKSVGFTLSDSNGTIATPSFALPADASTIPVVAAEDEASDSMVVFKVPDTYLFEAYLIRAFSKENPTTYQNQFGAIATVTFDNGESWKSEQRKLSYLKAWQKVTEISNEDKARLDAFLDTLQTTSE